MNRRTTTLWTLTALLGASLLLAAPGSASAERKDKRWRGDRDRRVERRIETRRVYRDNDRWNRQYRTWRGRRVYRDVIVIRDRGPRYRAYRAYCEPEFYHARRVVYVRPVRYSVAVSAVIGNVRIGVRARDRDYDYYDYGCNFCDARFSAFTQYRSHIDRCGHRPRGYRVVVQDWGHGPDDRSWWDDRHWEGEYADYGRYHEHNGSCDHGGHWDDDDWDD